MLSHQSSISYLLIRLCICFLQMTTPWLHPEGSPHNTSQSQNLPQIKQSSNQKIFTFWRRKLHVYILREAPTIQASLKIYLGLLVHRGETYQFSLLWIHYSSYSKSSGKNFSKIHQCVVLLVTSLSVASFCISNEISVPKESSIFQDLKKTFRWDDKLEFISLNILSDCSRINLM
jgi:hypothetical protein